MKVVEPSRRSGFWILLRRVPKRYAGFDARKFVRITTHIRIADDPHAIRAAPIVQQLNRDLEAEWIALAAGEKPRDRQRYDDALHISRGLGFGYAPAPELMTRPIEDLVRRVEVLIARRYVAELRDELEGIAERVKPLYGDIERAARRAQSTEWRLACCTAAGQ
jgi:hypothetical protein